jgi:hypothetical protein
MDTNGESFDWKRLSFSIANLVVERMDLFRTK